MARKNTTKSDNPTTITFDTRTKAVMADVNNVDKVNIKEKVTAVRELVPGKSTNEIVLVLQYYDYDVEKAIQAYLEDGAKEALTEWHFTGDKPSNKKKKNKKAKAAAANASQTGNSDTAAGASSLSASTKKNSIQNHTKEQPITNGRAHEDEEILRNRARLLDEEASNKISPSSSSSSTGGAAAAPSSVPDPPVAARGNSPPSRAVADVHQHHHKHNHKHSGPHQQPYQRQRTSSERSTSSIGSQGVKKPFAGLEKSTKDLQRQTISLERLRLGLDAEIEKAYKRVKAVFEDARNSLLDREVQIIRELDTLKVQAHDVCKMRQEKAAELKVRVERAEKLNTNELAELRADIKLFVSDRKIDEDLCKTTRFTYDSDHFMEEVKNFGTVVPVKCPYTTRRPSVSSVASSGHDEHVPHKPMHSDVDGSTASADNNLSMAEMAELQQRLKNSLQLQKGNKKKGLSVKSPPPRNRPNSAASDKPEGDQDEEWRRHKSGRRRRGPRETTENGTVASIPENPPQPAQSSPGGSPVKKSDRPNTGNRSPRRNYSGNQSSPRRYGSGGGRGRGRGGGGDGYENQRGDDRRPRNQEGQGRGGRGRDRGRRGEGRGRGGNPTQSSPNSTPVVNGPPN